LTSLYIFGEDDFSKGKKDLSKYEVGSETTKITDKILSQMVARTDFERELLKTVLQGVDGKSVESLFRLYLKSEKRKE
jgi:hypothetical protein